MLYLDEIGSNIVLLRKASDITQEQLALRADMSVSYLRTIEHGAANPTLEALNRLAKVLAVPAPLLLILSMDPAEVMAMMHDAKQRLEAAPRKVAG